MDCLDFLCLCPQKILNFITTTEFFLPQTWICSRSAQESWTRLILKSIFKPKFRAQHFLADNFCRFSNRPCAEKSENPTRWFFKQWELSLSPAPFAARTPDSAFPVPQLDLAVFWPLFPGFFAALPWIFCCSQQLWATVCSPPSAQPGSFLSLTLCPGSKLG